MRTQLLISLLLCTTAVNAAELRVHAAASLSDVLTGIGAQFERETGTRVIFNFGGSGTLARQIEEGVPGDVFFSADEERMDALDARGLVDHSTRTPVLSNVLVVAVRTDSAIRIDGVRGLLGCRRIALAQPDLVPAGAYAREFLRRSGVWTQLAPRLIPTDNVRAALAAVEAGNVDAGFVYRTDLAAAPSLRIAFAVTGSAAPAISYPIAVLRASRQPALARRFIGYLRMPAARQRFAGSGFVVR